jgi:hypothetical protein
MNSLKSSLSLRSPSQPIEAAATLAEQSPAFGGEFAKKIRREKSELVNDVSRPGKIVVDVNRHKGILGSEYVKG